MAWCFISILQTLRVRIVSLQRINNLDFIGATNFYVTVLLVVVMFFLTDLLFEILSRRRIEKIVLFAVTFSYALLCIGQYQDLYFCIGMVCLMGFSVAYCMKDTDTSRIGLKRPVFITGAIVCIILFVLFTGGCTVYKYLTYRSPNYDLGLFSQMFYYMKHTLTMNTTAERDMLLSHLCVHVSPVFYLLLPIYAIVSSPATLQILQAVVLAMAIIPLRLICKNHGLNRFETLAILVAYSAYPVISGGCFYDIHENMFLPVFLLFFLYYLESDQKVGYVISMLLIFSVKEDAAIYVAFIAIYEMFGLRRWKRGAVILLSALAYFTFTTVLLANIGEGAMTYRFNNMIYGEDGSMFGIIKTVFNNPAYIMTQMFTKDKLEFIIQVLAPLCFLPLLSRKWYRFILIGPFLMFNLMSDYEYFHSLFFQYVFGSGTLLFYLAVVNLSEMDRKIKSHMLMMLPVSCLLFFMTILGPKTYYITDYYDSLNQRTYQEFEEALNMIPDDASVTATTFLCPKLSNRKVLHELYYTDKSTEYIALDLRVETSEYSVNTYLNQDEYECLYYVPDKIAVFRYLDYE